MATNQYIILTDSAGPLYGMSKKFKVLQMKTPLTRQDGIKYLLDGSIDKSAGAIVKSWQYQLRVPYYVTDTEYGTIDDLKDLFMLNDPNGTPNDVITLTDHFGVEHETYFIGELSPENIITVLDGVNSSYMVVIALVEKTNA